LALGANLGKNKDTPLEHAADDYLALVKTFAPLADYLAINVSSPNTEGLRRLQTRQALHDLLAPLQTERRAQETALGRRVPLLVKLAPDLDDEALDDALDVLLALEVDGVIAANTTLARSGLHSLLGEQVGGLSGAPLGSRSLQMVQAIHARAGSALPIIAVGGIMNAGDAQRALDAGAALVQVYTGMVYAGPGLVQSILYNAVK
jgi:dihydroorotate dehydrogenase